MNKFIYIYVSIGIQKKGLCAIQILAEWRLVQSTVMCQEFASIIKSTMKNYPRSLIIQKEVCVFFCIRHSVSCNICSVTNLNAIKKKIVAPFLSVLFWLLTDSIPQKTFTPRFIGNRGRRRPSKRWRGEVKSVALSVNSVTKAPNQTQTHTRPP